MSNEEMIAKKVMDEKEPDLGLRFLPQTQEAVRQMILKAMTEYAMIFANSINDELNYALAEGERLSETAKHWQQKSAEKDKEIAGLKGDVLYWKGIAETPEVGKKTIEQFLERELAAAKDRIAELENDVERLKKERDDFESQAWENAPF